MTFHTLEDIGGSVVKSDERYVVKDNTQLNNLVVSSTKLNANCATNGHYHNGQEEVYMFIEGSGVIQLDNLEKTVTAGDIVLIEDGVFHKVIAGGSGCYFVTVFDGKRD